MTELEKVEYTKSFIDKLADGINPLTGEPIPEGDLLNNVRISRCMFYVSGILGGVIENLRSPRPAKKGKKSDKKTFYIEPELVQSLSFDEDQTYVGDVVKLLNELVNLDTYKKLLVKNVYAWLAENGYITEENISGTQVRRNTTQKGENFGFTAVKKISAKGMPYYVILCNVAAQKFIAENANVIAESQSEKESKQDDGMGGQPWTEEQDNQLAELFNSGLTVAGIAAEMKRSGGAIRARLVRLGLIADRGDIL